MEDVCLDCGTKISPGWDFCQSCGSRFEDQQNRTEEEQRIINKKIRKDQKLKKKEFRTIKREKWKQEAKKRFERSKNKIIAIGGSFLIISLVSGIFGWIMSEGTIFGFLIGFFTPLIILIIIFGILVECFD